MNSYQPLLPIYKLDLFDKNLVKKTVDTNSKMAICWPWLKNTCIYPDGDNLGGYNRSL